MRQILLIAAAALFFAYEQYSFFLWLRDHGPIGAALAHAWKTLRQDPMVFMAWNDMGVFTACVLVWLARDLRQRGLSFAWWFATLLLGCPPFLIYLARRVPEPGAAREHAHTVLRPQ